jgi:hypothetical protein
MRTAYTTADLTSRTFGRWFVLERAPRVPRQGEAWRCRCACGTERVIGASHLLHGKTRSCGCLARDIARRKRPRQRRDLRGHIVGELRVLRPGPNIPARSGTTRSRHGHTAWFCECACGRVVLVTTDMLTRARGRRTTHCGCRHLKPAPEPPPVATAAPAPVVAERTTTAQQALNRLHDEHSPLGRVRVVSRPADEDEEMRGVIHDADPWAD